MKTKIGWKHLDGEVDRIRKDASAYDKNWDIAASGRQFNLISGRSVVAVGDEALRVRRGKAWGIGFEGPEWRRSPDTWSCTRAPDDTLFVYSLRSLEEKVYGRVHRVDGAGCALLNDLAPPRSYARMALSPEGLLLFGGCGPARSGESAPKSDIFLLKGSKWKQLAEKGPPGRKDGAFVGTGRGALLWGGVNAKGETLTDCWSFHDGAWHRLPSAAGERGELPVQGFGIPAAIALDDDKILSFAFRDGAAVATLWDGDRWREIAELEPLPSKYGPTYTQRIAIDLARKALVNDTPEANVLGADGFVHQSEVRHILEADLSALLAEVSAIPYAATAPAKKATAKKATAKKTEAPTGAKRSVPITRGPHQRPRLR